MATRVCTDHFYLSDFQEDDLERYHARNNPDTRTLIRLKVGSVPNTDRSIGSFANRQSSSPNNVKTTTP